MLPVGSSGGHGRGEEDREDGKKSEIKDILGIIWGKGKEEEASSLAAGCRARPPLATVSLVAPA